MKYKIYVGIAVLAAVMLISGASVLAVASPATTSDPLVTLSYLTGPFRTSVNSHVNSTVTSLTNTFNTRANQVQTQITSAMTSNQAQVFVLRTLGNNGELTLPVGTEIMLRGGSATITGGSLVNHTTGAEQASGALTQNHMYVVAEAGSIRATANNTLVLVRGA